MAFFHQSSIAAAVAVLGWASPAFAQTNAVRLGKDLAHPAQYLARFRAESPLATRLQILQTEGLTVKKRLDLVPDLVVLGELPPVKLQGAPATAQKPMAKDLLRRIRQLRITGLFDYVEPDYYVKALLQPSDTAFVNGTLWGLTNNGANGGVLGADINATAAWDLTTGSTNVIVAVIDTGIRYTHDDLKDQVWRNPGEVAGNGIDDDHDGYVDNVFGINTITGSGNPMDDHNHGTHVSGTIGAAANNTHPHVGVAWNVRLMGCKFLDASGSGTISDAIACIDFAVGKGAKILNNSWGGGGFSQALLDAITAARNHGVLFVAAAGNDSNDTDLEPAFPASYDVDNVVAVAAVDRADGLAWFSNYGARSVHLGAPGVSIYSCVADSDTAYGTFNGTSMAAPHVSGVAALLWASTPAASLQQVRQRLSLGAVPIGALAGKTVTGGRLDAYRALTLPLEPDGQLELTVAAADASRLTAGSTTLLQARVSDLVAVTDATVTGVVVDGPALAFRNDGLDGDEMADDGIYSAWLPVPTDRSTVVVLVEAAAAGKIGTNAFARFGVIVRPSNDAFANRIPITSLPALKAADNRDATRDPGEPVVAGVGGGHTVWWTWTASQSATYTISTAGSSFDTVLGAYTGTSVSGLSLVAENDDAGPAFSSEIIFYADMGSVLQIVVDGYDDAFGKIQLSVSANPPITNDYFEDRAPISGIDITVTGSSYGATSEVNEPFHAGRSPRWSVWWTWTSPVSDWVTISTAGSSYDTTLGVYTGTMPMLFTVADNDDAGGGRLTSEVRFQATQGVAYQIAVAALGYPGSLVLNITQPPVNDRFASRIPLKGAFAETSGFNLGASAESNEPLFDSRVDARTVWWTWTAPTNGNATITTLGSTFDTVLSVYTGKTLSQLKLVTKNDDFLLPNLTHSQVTFDARAGTNYQIQVDGYYDAWDEIALSGRVALTITLDGASRLALPARLPDGSLGVELTGEAERPYVLCTSADLHTWFNIATNTLIGRRFVFTDPDGDPATGRRFYRARAGSLIGQDNRHR